MEKAPGLLEGGPPGLVEALALESDGIGPVTAAGLLPTVFMNGRQSFVATVKPPRNA